MKKIKAVAPSLVLWTCLNTVALAGPSYINYQGLLNGADGHPLPTGNYTMQFNIYDQAQLGTRVWGPFIFDGAAGTGHGPLVPVVNGRFNVVIGPQDTSSNSISAAFANTNRFMEITVASGPPILPRQQFLSTAYAFEAINARYAQQAGSLVQELADALCPPGSILAFGGSTSNIPSGWLLCDGRLAAGTNYPRLFAAVGTAWGNGTYDQNGTLESPANPATDFNLPDLRGMFLRGVNGSRAGAFGDPDFAGRAAGATGGLSGNNAGSFQDDALQNVAGTIGDFNTFAALKGTPTGPFARSYAYGNTGIGSGSGDPYDRITMDLSRSARTSSETRPNNAYVNYIIKY